MFLKRITTIFLAFAVLACNKEYHLSKIEGKRIEINDSLNEDQKIEAYIKPFRQNVNKNLDSVISYAPKTYSKTDGELNTAIGNLMADAVYEESNPVFNSRTGKNIDFVILNHGGIRSIIPKGDITTRTAYSVMPFENSVVVVQLKGTQIKEMLIYLALAKRAHPLSKHIQISLDSDFQLKTATINNAEIESDKTYYVATNDYLYNGGDRMTFFKPNDSLFVLDYKIRNVLIDYFKKRDTINPVIDERFIQIK
ncbi:5'-nucleotidase C-terminal domain-containing protein [Winogradskyella alexanderae]|uniref:5'-nucleotidase C-terminal domain-containing protein n=1 Tax=Winogradskyella alexanderae TaxID=2877123 RepID=A0ABS7XSR2_9FLAO|nr:5'-nucleotidase [Winogradskyella alexanderae]MCA0133070.1 5'-nucleotidase C-terminal domain-containing protein [Winogradskyella alexanderae]